MSHLMLTTKQEFSIEIPDKDADTIHSGTYFIIGGRCWFYLTNDTTVDQAVTYIQSQPDGL
jgi:acyl carrier protein